MGMLEIAIEMFTNHCNHVFGTLKVVATHTLKVLNNTDSLLNLVLLGGVDVRPTWASVEYKTAHKQPVICR